MGRPKSKLVMPTLALLLMAGNGLSGCGGGGGGSKGTITIGVDLPETGADRYGRLNNLSSHGDHAGALRGLNGVKFAVQKAGGSVGGWTLTVESRDDVVNGVYNADKGVENVTDLIHNKAVVAMIGPFTSAVAKAEIPVANAAGLTMISPSNTEACLTKDLPGWWCGFHPEDLRKKANNYFRVVASDDLQGPAMADYAYNTLGIKTIGIVDDKSAYGVGIADSFQAQFQKDGGKFQRQSYDPQISNSATLNTTIDWRGILQGFMDFGATAIYVGGTDDRKACQPRGQMNALGIGRWPFLGGDGILTGQCVDDASDAAVGVSAAVVGADASQIASATSVIADFKRSFPDANDYGIYTMSAYDAANIEIAAIKKALARGADPKKISAFREAVRNNVAHTTNFQGVLGTTTFDANGDTSAKIISVFTVKKEDAARVAVGDLTCGNAGGPNANYCFDWANQSNFGA